MGSKVNQTQLAEIHGVTDVTLWQWQKEGMPIEERNTRGLSNVYDSAATIEWRVAREVKKVREESPRDRLLIAQERLAQLQIGEKERSLLPADETESEFTRLIVMARQRILQVTGLLSTVLDDKQRVALDEHLEEALKELSCYDPSTRNDQAGGGGPGASGASVGSGVGGGETPAEREIAVPGTVPAEPDAVPPRAARRAERPRGREVDAQKSAQIGWTDGVLVQLARLHHRRGPGADDRALPGGQERARVQREKFEPMVEATPALAEQAHDKSRATENRQDFKDFAGGFLKFVGSNSPANVKSTTAKNLAVEEPDDCNLNIKGQGDSITMLEERGKRFPARSCWWAARRRSPGFPPSKRAWSCRTSATGSCRATTAARSRR
jgi:hypothetical protein